MCNIGGGFDYQISNTAKLLVLHPDSRGISDEYVDVFVHILIRDSTLVFGGSLDSRSSNPYSPFQDP